MEIRYWNKEIETADRKSIQAVQLQKLKKRGTNIMAHGIQAAFIAYLIANLFSFDGFDTYLLFFKKVYEKKPVTNICYAGTNSIYVDYTGDIYPCENLVGRIQPIGNICDEKISISKNYSDKIKEMKCYQTRLATTKAT